MIAAGAKLMIKEDTMKLCIDCKHYKHEVEDRTVSAAAFWSTKVYTYQVEADNCYARRDPITGKVKKTSCQNMRWSPTVELRCDPETSPLFEPKE